MEELIEIGQYILPSLITGGVAIYFFKQHIALENSNKRFEGLVKRKEQSLPIKLQAYERMTLFLERIKFISLFNRVNPTSPEKTEYAKLLISTVNTEFEHNLVQQIYISTDCWKAITQAKNTILNTITNYSLNEEVKSIEDFVKQIHIETVENGSPIDIALEILQEEVKEIL